LGLEGVAEEEGSDAEEEAVVSDEDVALGFSCECRFLSLNRGLT